MARAYGQRPSSFLGLSDPLGAYQFDAAVFGLEEAIDGLLERERAAAAMADLDAKGRSKVKQQQRRMERLVDRILGHAAAEAAVEAGRVRREVDYVWNEDRTMIVAWRYKDEHGD